MENHMKRIGRHIALFTMLLMLAACDKNDDINAIFRERTWYLTYIQEENEKFYAKDKLYSIDFKNDYFKATMPNGATIKGNWYADGGGSHTFYCRNLKKEGKISDDDIAGFFYDILNNADSYEGDTNWLQIRTKDKNRYMQFYNK